MPSRLERKELITEKRKTQILEAALDVFARRGYGETTIPDIAHEAGIAVGTIYNYFESKKDLLISIFTIFIFNDTFTRLIDFKSETDDEAFLSSIIEERLNFGFDNIDRFLFLLTEIQRDPELRRQYNEELIKPLMKYLEHYFESRMESGVFRSLNKEITARAMVGMIIGFLILNRVEDKTSPCRRISRSDNANVLADLALGGLKVRD